MDNAGSTNKNFYMVGFCQEIVQHGFFLPLELSFMIAGHTVDRLFSKVANTYNKSDVFNFDDLVAQVFVDNNGKLVKLN